MILASGLMAGGALGGVLGAGLRLIPGFRETLIQTPFYNFDPISQPVSAVLFASLCLYVWFVAQKRDAGAGERTGGVMDQAGKFVADAVLGSSIRLWGGDVMCPSGTGRFIADSWFSDEPLPAAYTHPAAARVRETGGVGGKSVDREAVEAYLRAVDLARRDCRRARCRRRRPADCAEPISPAWRFRLEVMWDLAMEVLGKGDPVPYARAVEASTGKPPEPSHPEAKRERVAELLGRAGLKTSGDGALLNAVDAWRRDRVSPMASVKALGAAVIAHFDNLSAKNLVPYLPAELARVPRANIDFLPIKDAWFSGSMNYLGRARTREGAPLYEASYEINASLQISYPEFEQLVSHEVVPGHVTTFAYLQDLYVRGKAGFEATVLTMNTRAATLFEGIANNAILIAYGVTELDQLPDDDLQIGVLLALLQDDAKNQSSYMTWGEGREQKEVAAGAAPRFPGNRRARRQALRRVGTASAAGPHVSARVSRRHGQGGRAAPQASAGARAARALRLQRPCGHPDHRPGTQSIGAQIHTCSAGSCDLERSAGSAIAFSSKGTHNVSSRVLVFCCPLSSSPSSTPLRFETQTVQPPR